MKRLRLAIRHRRLGNCSGVGDDRLEWPGQLLVRFGPLRCGIDHLAVQPVLLPIERPERPEPSVLDPAAADAVEQPHRATDGEAIWDRWEDVGVGDFEKKPDLDGDTRRAIDDGEFVVFHTI